MTYEEIVTSNVLYLPISNNNNSFRTTIRESLNKYLGIINKIENGPLHIEHIDVDGDYVKNVQQRFITGLLQTIDIYYEGRPAKAYQSLVDTLDNDLKDFREILKIREFEPNENFYRIRINKENFPLSASEMFHIPFQLRGLVATQRYSIPGFPSLYLGSSIYACWEEMKRPNVNDFQAVRLESTKTINYLDLTRPLFEKKYNLRTRDIYHYLMTWPLIACCSIKVGNYSNTFLPEYIIPQLLLQWVRENRMIDGIKYNSTHIDVHKTTSIGDFSNLVLPVKSDEDYGHCSELLRMFKMTPTSSIQLKDIALGNGALIMGDPDPRLKVEQIEIANGRNYPYNYSKLGDLEEYLLEMEAGII